MTTPTSVRAKASMHQAARSTAMEKKKKDEGRAGLGWRAGVQAGARVLGCMQQQRHPASLLLRTFQPGQLHIVGKCVDVCAQNDAMAHAGDDGRVAVPAEQ